ncbi:hypothetical protein ES703_97870 [subsurface metagenome]
MTEFKATTEFVILRKEQCGYAFHDRAVVREKAGQIPLGGLISKAIVPGIAANAVFLLVWALLFRVANVAVKGIGEAGANWLPIGLWLGGTRNERRWGATAE